MVTTRHGAITAEEHAEEPNRTEETTTGPRADEEDAAGDRVARLEERLDRMTTLVERLLEAQVQGVRAQPQPYAYGEYGGSGQADRGRAPRALAWASH